jgi:hypothetical protein
MPYQAGAVIAMAEKLSDMLRNELSAEKKLQHKAMSDDMK